MIRNLTPHEVRVRVDADEDVVFHPDGVVARISSKQVPDGSLDGIPVTKTVWGEVENLPDREEDVTLIVSSLVLSRANRPDCVAPDTSPSGAIRDEKNQIVAVKGFQRI